MTLGIRPARLLKKACANCTTCVAKLKISVNRIQDASGDANVVAIDDATENIEEHTAESDAPPGVSHVRSDSRDGRIT